MCHGTGAVTPTELPTKQNSFGQLECIQIMLRNYCLSQEAAKIKAQCSFPVQHRGNSPSFTSEQLHSTPHTQSGFITSCHHEDQHSQPTLTCVRFYRTNRKRQEVSVPRNTGHSKATHGTAQRQVSAASRATAICVGHFSSSENFRRMWQTVPGRKGCFIVSIRLLRSCST